MFYAETLRNNKGQSAAKRGIMRRLTIDEVQIKLKELYPNEELILLKWGGTAQPARIKCLKCGSVYQKKNGGTLLDKRHKSICKKCFPTQNNILKDTFDLPKGYSYIEPYCGMHKKILIKHDECGFIWKITPSNIKLGKGCPKCNIRISKGEQKIINWLEENNIDFINHYKVNIEGYNLFVDFYLPHYDIYIEYNGEQHYYPVKHFGGNSKFKKQVELDNLKRKFLKNKLIEIPYTYFSSIDDILESSTTILKGSTLQAMVMEVEKLLKGV